MVKVEKKTKDWKSNTIQLPILLELCVWAGSQELATQFFTPSGSLEVNLAKCFVIGHYNLFPGQSLSV